MDDRARKIADALNSARASFEADAGPNATFGFEKREDEQEVLRAMHELIVELAIQLHARDRIEAVNLISAAKSVRTYAQTMERSSEDCTCGHGRSEHTVYGCYKDVNGREGSNTCPCSSLTGYTAGQDRTLTVRSLTKAAELARASEAR